MVEWAGSILNVSPARTEVDKATAMRKASIFTRSSLRSEVYPGKAAMVTRALLQWSRHALVPVRGEGQPANAQTA
jgi:hypothetical protein